MAREESLDVPEAVLSPEELPLDLERRHPKHSPSLRGLGERAQPGFVLGARGRLHHRDTIEAGTAQRVFHLLGVGDALSSRPDPGKEHVDHRALKHRVEVERRDAQAEQRVERVRGRWLQRHPLIGGQPHHVFEGVQPFGRDLGWALVTVGVEQGREQHRLDLKLQPLTGGKVVQSRPRQIGVGRDEVEAEAERSRHGNRWYRRAVRLAGCLLVLTSLWTTNVSAAVPRWPSWPSEISRTAAPLLDPGRSAHERDRTAALVRLQRYPTPLIEDALQVALTEDPSIQVVREALRICYLRRASVCLEPATALYRDGNTMALHAPALRVLATDPRGERLDILLEAMLDPSDTIRAEAAQLAGWAPVRGDALARTRRALLSKLSDTASVVRERAVTSLGLQGPGEGTLAIARLLEDPEPDVRAAAAVALGRLGDAKATAALLRAIEGQNEGNVTRAMLGALARLPGDSVVQALLAFLDDPPPGVGSLTVAEAIGDRNKPEAALIDGLVERLRDPGAEEAARRALLWLGDAAAVRLQEALARGLGARLDADVRRLLDATSDPQTTASPEEAWPAADDVPAWRERLTVGRDAERLRAAAALGAQSPAWLADHVHARIDRGALEPARPFVFALATMPEPTAFRDDSVIPWARLAGWASDRTLSESDRCIATLALGQARGKAAEALASDTLGTLLGDASPRVRACTAFASRRVAPELAALALLDSDPGPRAAAVSVVAAEDHAARRTHLASVDPDPHVRALATAAPHGGAAVLVTTRPSPTPWASPPLWIDDDGGPVLVLGTRPVPWGVRIAAPTSR